MVEADSIKWLADMCDGDARIALNSLQLAMQSILDQKDDGNSYDLKVVTLDAIKDGKGIRKLYDTNNMLPNCLLSQQVLKGATFSTTAKVINTTT